MTSNNGHEAELYQSPNGNHWVVCACGWISNPSKDRFDAEADHQRHAPEGNIRPGPRSTAGNDHAGAPPRPRRFRHEQLRSDMITQPDGTLLFRARCSCGWASDPVDIGLSFAVWDDHRDRARHEKPG